MPTGYTMPIEDREDFTFEEYVWRCAQGFGPFVMQRDDSLDTPRPRKVVPHDYHERELTKAKAQLAEAQLMTLGDAEAHASLAFRDDCISYEKSMTNVRAVWGRYQTMRAKAVAWEPPTPEHARLREFMIEQIDVCTRFMDPENKADSWRPTRKTGEEWIAKLIESAKANIAYHESGWAADCERARKANVWIDALAASVPPPTGALR